MMESRWGDMAAAYVLDALDDSERADFEARLAVDEALRDEVRAQRELLGILAEAAPPRRAPEGLRQRILDEAGSTRPIRSAPSASASTPAPPTRRPLAAWVLAAAAAIVALSLGVSNRRISQEADALAVRLDQTEQLAREQAAAVAARDSLLASFLGPDVRSATLASTGAPPSARIFLNATTGSVVVAAFDLPPAPDGRTYQLWGIADGQDPVSLGTFQTGADGTAIVRRTIPAGATFAISAVTDEPAGGSPQPTTTPFLVGSWTED